jgi:hypothetical protein
MMYEIRNYHFKPELQDQYREWAKTRAVPHLGKELDLVGFWIVGGDAPEVSGEAHDKLGVANITWIIKWRDLAQRNEVLPRLLASPEWNAIFKDVPGGPSSYLRIEAKFADALME